MPLRRCWLLACLLGVGCHSLALPEDGDSDGERPVGFYEKSLVDDTAATLSPLSLAADAMQRGDEAAAGAHLSKYLAMRPDHNEVRLHYAELLLRQERRADARAEFLRFLAVAQEQGDSTLDERILCHSRLMDMAATEDDEYGMRYHRGLGMYLLALERAKLGDLDGTLPVESLLCRAAGELTTARHLRPGEAQPCWYLYKIWSALGQQSAAARWLERAEAAAPFSGLPPTEQRGLQLAGATQLPPLARP